MPVMKPSAWIAGPRHAWNRRYAGQVLRLARAGYEQWSAELADSTLLDDHAVRRLRPVVRTYEVQLAAFQRWPGWWCYLVLRVVTAVVAVAAPAWGLVRWGPEPPWASLACYVCVGGVLAFAYGIQQHTTRVWHLGVAAAAVGLGLATTWLAIPPDERPAMWRALGAGVLATGALLVLTVARLATVLAVRARLFRPRAMRRAGWLLPSQHAAVLLLTVLLTFEQARPSNRPPRFRANFLRWLDGMTAFIRWEFTTTGVNLGLADHLGRDVAHRAAVLTAYLRGHQTRLLHDDGLTTYDAVSAELAAAVVALAAGDWSLLEAAEAAVDEPSRLIRITRRVLPAMLLTGTAIGLPYVPGVPDGGSALIGIQLGLVAAAALSLVPLEQAHRDKITEAFSSVSK